MERASGDVGGAVLRAIEQSAVAVTVLDTRGVITSWGDGAARLFGWAAEEVVGRQWVDIGVIGDAIRRRGALRVITSVLDGASPSGEWVARRRDGGTVRVHTVHEPLRDEAGGPAGVVSLSYDVSHREGFEQALLQQALHDRLTGLPGKSLVEQHLASLLSDRREPHVAVLFIDLDGFKAVNDCHGHAAGDAVLVEVAARIRAAVRTSDIVARVGGDEFVVVVDLNGTPGGADEVGARVHAALRSPVAVAGGAAARVAASIGSVVAEHGDDPDTVIKRADVAMYEAKRTK